MLRSHYASRQASRRTVDLDGDPHDHWCWRVGFGVQQPHDYISKKTAVRETVEAKPALFWDFLEVGLEDFGLVDLENVFENVVEEIGVGEGNAEKRGEVAERH